MPLCAVAGDSRGILPCERRHWEPVGLSGGGGMFSPAISPADPNLMMLNCDMSAAYLSEDGGHNWRMIHHAQLRSDTQCRPAFHPSDPNVIYASSGGRASNQPRPRPDVLAHRRSARSRSPARSRSIRPTRTSCWRERATAGAICRGTQASHGQPARGRKDR